MKTTYILCILLLIPLTLLWAQSPVESIQSLDPIAISDIKTTHFILKDKLKYIDIGSRYFVTDTVENIVKVKHIGGDFTELEDQKETNLTLVTENGDYYTIPLFFYRNITNTTYKLDYAESNLNSMASSRNTKNTAIFELCHYSKKAKSNYDIKGNRDLLLTKISGIFYRGDHIVIRMEIKNFSSIDLDMDQILFRFLKKKRLGKDIVYQERVLRPVNVCNDARRVKGNGGIEIYNFIFDKFTPNDDENLQVDILEKNGGRSATIKIPRKSLLKPTVI